MSIFKARLTLKRIKRDDLVNRIVEIEQQQQDFVSKIEDNKSEIENIKCKFKSESLEAMKKAYCKKIMRLQRENESIAARMDTLDALLGNYNELKLNYDDYHMYSTEKKNNIDKLLEDTVRLTQQLNKVTSIVNEKREKIINTQDMFKETNEARLDFEGIDQMNNEENQLYAMLENEELNSHEDVIYNKDSVVETPESEQLKNKE